MGLSVNQFTYAGVDEFDLNFALGYASQSDVTAYTGSDPIVDLAFDWLSDNRVRLGAGHGLSAGDTVVFRRTVSKLSTPVDLSQPGAATRDSLAANYLHTMYIMHEVLDERTSDTFPWELVGGQQAFETVVNFPYLSTYTTAKGI